MDAELRKYNETQTGKRNEYRKKVKEGKMMGKGDAGGGGGGEDDDGEGRAAKRVRRGSGEEEEEEGGDDSGLLGQQLGVGVGVVGVEGGRYRLEEGGDEEFEGGEVELDEGEGGEGGGGYDLRERKGEEEEEEESEEEEDDEDTYPDEGRRLSSIEAEAEALELAGRDSEPPVGSSADEEDSGSGEESY